MRHWLALIGGFGTSLGATQAFAQAPREADAAPPTSWSEAVARATEGGGYLPLTLTPRVEAGRALGAGSGGYDSAKQSGVMRAFAEARVYRTLALRVGTRLGDSSQRFRPSVGARAQLLSQQDYGVDLGVALFYQAEGFTEPEGEIEGTVSLGRRFGRLLLLANITYGQDPEAFERDGEVSVAGLARLAPWAHLGLDARARFDLGSERAKLLANDEPTYDLDAGPVLQLALGPLALGAHVGASAVHHLDQSARWGVVATAGLGTAF